MLTIRKIEISKLGTVDEASIALPECGLVLVTGRNGSGKSISFIDSVALGLWGRAVRRYESGNGPWPNNVDSGLVQVETPELVVTRKRLGSKIGMEWRPKVRREADQPVYETRTKAQAALEALVGDYEVWRRTAVFSTKGQHFAEATDAERKRLLEQLLDIERYDQALERCRNEIKLKTKQIGDKNMLCGRLEARIESSIDQVKQLRAALIQMPKARQPAVVLAEIEKIKQSREAVRQLYQENSKRYSDFQQRVRLASTKTSDARTNVALAEQSFRQAQDQLRKAKDGRCPTCKQPLPNKGSCQELEQAIVLAERRLAELTAAYQAAQAADHEEQKKIEAEEATLLAESASVSQDYERFTEQLLRLGEEHQAAIKKDEIKKSLDELEQKLDQQQAELQEQEEAAAFLSYDLDVLTDTESVLGVRGARTLQLMRALEQLEHTTNHWLQRLTPGVGVRIRPFSEKADGQAVEKIGLGFTGLRAPDYGGLSNGQQQRINIAFLFALADLASAAHGSEPGTLFLDEVMDSPLDQDGTEALLQILVEMMKSRAIVVISNSQTTIDRLRGVATTHYVVQDGTVLC